MDERVLRPLTEASYLTAGNAWRCRAILRHFYLQHESMRHFLYPQELLRELSQSQYFEQYGENELEQDLRQLVEWGNLVARQDTRRVTSVEEFRKKRCGLGTRNVCCPDCCRIWLPSDGGRGEDTSATELKQRVTLTVSLWRGQTVKEILAKMLETLASISYYYSKSARRWRYACQHHRSAECVRKVSLAGARGRRNRG